MVSVHQVDLACDEAAYLQSVTPVSSAYVAPATVPWVYDNATSISITPHLSELEHVEILATPFQLGGIGVGQLAVTHRGLLRFLPVPLSVCYYSAQATSSLVSLGFLQTQGCGWSFRGVTNSVLTDPAGAVLDVPMLQSNLLTTVSTSRYNAGRGPFSDPALSMVASPAPSLALPTAHSLIPLYPTLVVDELLAMVAHLPLASKTGLQLRRSRVRLDRIPLRLLSMLAPFQFMTKEQRARCERVELVHYLTHAGDDALCQALDGGAYQWANVTSADVRLNRKWRGPCVACLQGKFHAKSMPTSVTPPAQAVGELLSIDTQALPVKSSGGNLYYIDSIDEFSSDVQVTPAKSLKSVDLFAAIMSLVHRRYNAYGHKVTHIMSDPLPAMEPVVAMLGSFGILLTFTTPGQHAQRVERSIQGLAGRRRALLASLPY